MLATIRRLARNNPFIRKLIGYHLASSGLADSFFRNYKMSPSWDKRVQNVLASSDNDLIPRVRDAGSISGGIQIMHNGLKIYLGSYYGPEYAKMLLLSKGVHEPQEERVFMEVLKDLPSNAVMIEMGAFWSFYSMWFNRALDQATNFMVEPDEFNLGQGMRNFRLNGIKGKFIQAFIGSKSSNSYKVRTVSVDDIVAENSIDFVHVLHSDIQGYEYEMLRGAEVSFDKKKIAYVFISTHSNEIHYKCLQFLLDRNFILIASADLNESFSEDGLIVVRSPDYNGIGSVDISIRH